MCTAWCTGTHVSTGAVADGEAPQRVGLGAPQREAPAAWQTLLVAANSATRQDHDATCVWALAKASSSSQNCVHVDEPSQGVISTHAGAVFSVGRVGAGEWALRTACSAGLCMRLCACALCDSCRAEDQAQIYYPILRTELSREYGLFRRRSV